MESSLIIKAKSYLKDYKNRKRIFSVFLVLAVIVVFCTVYALILPAITLTASSDKDIDVESPESWQKIADTAELKDEWSCDALKIAETQLGYIESNNNFREDENGVAHGYTRYGDFVNKPYGDWNTAFVLFCTNYAKIPKEALFYSEDFDEWRLTAKKNGIYDSVYTADPEKGDIILIDTDNDEIADRTGFVSEYTETEEGYSVKTIEGQLDGRVAENEYTEKDSAVVGYLKLGRAEKLYKEKSEKTTSVPASENTTVMKLPKSEQTTDITEKTTGTASSVSNTDENTVQPVSREFTYEDENFEMDFKVSSEKAEAANSLSGEDKKLVLNVIPVDKDSDKYISVYDGVQEIKNRKVNLDYYDISLEADGEKLEISDFDISAQIHAKAPVVEGLEEEFIKEANENADEAYKLSAVNPNDILSDELGATAFAKDEISTAVLSVNVNNDGIALLSEVANPNFKVQYYAWINTVDSTKPANSVGSLSVIDTSGGNLPKNGATLKSKSLYVKKHGTKYFEICTSDVLTRIYKDALFDYIKAPNSSYFNRLYLNDHYQIKEVWVLKNGHSETSTNVNDWNVYSNPKSLHFTNRPLIAETKDNFILIEDGTVIKLVYNCTAGELVDPATFYDYDISTGVWYSGNSTSISNTVLKTQPTGKTYIWAKTNQQGINSSSNYSGTGKKLAFGNANTGSGLKDETWTNNSKSNLINRFNSINRGVGGGSVFSLASKMTNGVITYSSGIVAPKLFNEPGSEADGAVPGKKTYKNYSLAFDRSGDTYTFDSVPGTVANNLQLFFHPVTGTTEYTTIWTNNYWPMDSAPSYGVVGHDFKHGNNNLLQYRRFSGSNTNNFPPSDDGEDHNAYFGMRYQLEFKLDSDYVGPLEYYFYGDDDLWVFLDDKLICDIGGVHSSVGEYVNLWDYMAQGVEGTHKLTLYYTERGASGSTCFMRFTLPSVSSATTEQTTGQLQISKKIFGLEPDREYNFDITFTNSDDSPIYDDYAYTKYSADGTVISNDILLHDGGQFSLKGDEYIVVKYMPIGTKFIVSEQTGDGYYTVVEIEGSEKVQSNEISGQITEETHTVTVDFTNIITYEMPATGGIGANTVIISGAVLIAVAVMSKCKLKRRKRKS